MINDGSVAIGTVSIGMGPARSERAVGEVRWVPRSMITVDNKLQQRWVICEYDEHGVLRSQREEWRDVPVVSEP
jgi:hypothetical protein